MHHILSAADLTRNEQYKILSGAVIPRPIAFVTTLSTEKTGVVNAAPFSFFNVVSASPPLLSVSVARKDGVMKDTTRNALHFKELVIHITDEDILNHVNETAANLSPDQSEIERTDFHVKPSESVGTPGIIEAKIRFECKLHTHVPIKNEEGKVVNDLIIAEVVCYHLSQDVYDNEKGYVSSKALKPVARLAGSEYATLHETFSLKRPE